MHSQPQQQMEVSGQLHAQTTLATGKQSGARKQDWMFWRPEKAFVLAGNKSLRNTQLHDDY